MLRRTRTVAALVAASAVALAVFLTWRARHQRRAQDDPPPRDNDLRVERPALDPERNAFTHFDSAGRQLHWPASAGERVRHLLDGNAEWDSQFATSLLDQNRAALESLEEGMSRERLQVPEIEGFHTSLAYLAQWRDLTYLASLRSMHLLTAGNATEAFDEAVRMVKFGHAIEGAKATVIHYLAGSEIKEIGLRTIRRMLSRVSLSSHQLGAYALRLQAFPANEPGMVDALRAEYTFLATYVDGVAAGDVLVDVAGKPEVISPGYIFKPNRTKAALGTAYRCVIENVSKNCVAMDFREIDSLERTILVDEVREIDGLGLPVLDKRPVDENAIGNIFCAMVLTGVDRVLTRKCEENVQVAATRALMALKGYQAETGRLPASLTELSPQYLEAVPVDDFDGKPLRYSPEGKTVFSVGKDGEELSFKIEF